MQEKLSRLTDINVSLKYTWKIIELYNYTIIIELLYKLFFWAF